MSDINVDGFVQSVLLGLEDVFASGEVEAGLLDKVNRTPVEGNTITLVFDDGRRVRLTAELLS